MRGGARFICYETRTRLAPLLYYGIDDAPALEGLGIGGKERAVAANGVGQHPFISVWMAQAKAAAVTEVHVYGFDLVSETGFLDFEVEVNAFVRVNPNGEMIVNSLPRERVFELQSDFGNFFGKVLTGLNNDGHMMPPRVIDIESDGGKGFGV